MTGQIAQGGARRHPRGLYILCMAETWERFSYYGMRALLLLYLVDHLRMADGRAVLVYGAYTSLVYGSGVIGGWVADRFVGQWRGIVGGACLVLAGHIGLAAQELGHVASRAAEPLVFASLALIITGTGLFKPNSTNLVGQLYPDGDDRRTAGFHLFYFGINVGGAISALVCGALATRFGWGFGLGAAAVGMSIGLVFLIAGRDQLRPAAIAAPPLRLGALVAPAAMVAGGFALLTFPWAVGPMLLVAFAAALWIVARFAAIEATPVERRHVAVVLALVLTAAIFWSLSEQAGSALILFADRMVDLGIGPVTLTAPQTQAFNPVFILLLTPFAAVAWSFARRRGAEPGLVWKHVAALALAGAGFAVLGIGIAAAEGGGRIALGWLALSYLLQTAGEVCLAPTAYDAVSRLAPRRIASLLMGLWLFSISIGNFVGSHVAVLVARPTGGIAAASEAARYADVFLGVATVALCAGVALAFAARSLQRWATR